MNLVYLDDSGTRDKGNPFQTMTAVIVPDEEFFGMEILMKFSAEDILPENSKKSFEEFHAYELYGGYGPFEGVDRDKRFDAIKSLLGFVEACKSSVLYGAVDKRNLAEKLYGSADPVDMCFRMCIEGIEELVNAKHSGQLALLIVDDCEKEIKKTLRASFKRHRNQVWEANSKKYDWTFHDDMYFGNSADSAGIQLADLCGFFIAKHLKKEDTAAEVFYEMIQDRIVYQRVEPE